MILDVLNCLAKAIVDARSVQQSLTTRNPPPSAMDASKRINFSFTAPSTFLPLMNGTM
jgi:hypothetical protein